MTILIPAEAILADYKLGELADRTITNLKTRFATTDHEPSKEMWEDLEKTAAYLEQMANGTLEAKFYLNDLPPGVGKTTLVIVFVKELLASKFHDGVSVLICVPLLEEIRELIDELELAKEQVGVVTSDKKYNELGSDTPDSCRVVITSQQMIERRLSGGKRLQDLEALHFNGERRQVLLWDEALIPWEEVSINVDAIARMSEVFRKHDGGLADELIQLAADVTRQTVGSEYPLPDFEKKYGLTEDDVKRDFGTKIADNNTRKDIYSLWRLSGKNVRVRKDVGGNTLLDWKDSFPDDFLPVMIFDASGRVRTMYDYFGQSRGNLEVITSARKKTTNVRVHHRNQGAGKSQWRKKSALLLQQIAAEILREPDRPTLVIHHKPDDYETKVGAVPDIPRVLGELVGDCANMVSYCQWGKHKQTNEFRDIDKVIFAGILHSPDACYELRGRASLGLKSDEELSLEQFEAIEQGELRNELLQAMNRGAMRKCNGEESEAMDLYVFASIQTCVPGLLKELLPESQFLRWNPLDEPLTGKVGDALTYIDLFFAEHPDELLPFTEVYKALGMSKSNFRDNVRKHPDFMAEVKGRTIIEASGGGTYKTSFRKLDF